MLNRLRVIFSPETALNSTPAASCLAFIFLKLEKGIHTPFFP
jgi:hypothetical protein